MQHGVKRVSLSQEQKRLKKERDVAKIANYRQLTKHILHQRENDVRTLEVLEQTTSLLLLNPEFYTVWNYRREVLIDQFKQDGVVKDIPLYESYLENDLKLGLALLKRYPKCYWIWHHRQWCLFELYSIDKLNWQKELAIVGKLLELDSRNYHGWQYRRFVIENIEADVEKKNNNVSSSLQAIRIDEFKYTTAKINKNISNFSAWHNRSQLIPKIYQLVTEGADFKVDGVQYFDTPYTILVLELELIKTGMYMDSDDTSVWLYLYWLLSNDLFVSALKSGNYKKTYLEILHEQLGSVTELNELEKSDHANNQDHCWCLKTIVFIKTLINQEEGIALLSDEIEQHLKTLIEIDPLRRGKYLDQLHGKAPII